MNKVNVNQAKQLLSMLLSGAVDTPVAVNRKRGAKSGKKTRQAKAPKDEAAIEASRQKNNALVVEAFTKAGYADVQPRVNVLTYDKWLEKGRRVRKGEKSIRVGNFALFHLDQTDAEAGMDEPAASEAA